MKAPTSKGGPAGRLTIAAAGPLAALVFWCDGVIFPDAAMSIAYLAVLALVARAADERLIVRAAVGCIALAMLSWFLAHASAPTLANVLRTALSSIALATVGALLVGRERARMLRGDLESSRADLQNFMNSVPQILWRATPDAGVDLYNRRYADLVGRDAPEEIAAADWLKDMHPDDRDRAWTEVRASFDGAKPLHTTVRLRHADGSYRWMSLDGRPVFDEHRRLTHYYGGSTDIHEEVVARSEAQGLKSELESSQLELVSFMNLVPQILWRATPDGRVDRYNERYTEVTGRDWRDVVERQDWLDDIHPDDRAWYQTRVREAFAAEQELRATLRLRQREGGHRWYSLTGRPARDEAGAVIRYYGGASDIDAEVLAREELQQARAALEASRREVEFFANSVPHILWRGRADGQIEYFNARFGQITGVDGNAMLDDARYLDVVHPDDRPMLMEKVAAAIATLSVSSVQVRLRQADGSYRWMHLHDHPVISPADGAVQRFGGAVDIHDEVVLRHELIKMREELEHSRGELENFADSVPHIQWRLNESGRVDYLNRRYTELTGHSRDTAIEEQSWQEYYHPDDLEMAWSRFSEAVATGADRVGFYYRLRHADGAYRWMKLSGRAIRSASGEVAQWYGGTVDAQEEVLAQQRLEELLVNLEQRVAERTEELLRTEARYASLFEVSNMTFAEVDFGGVQPRLDALRDGGVRDLRAYLADHPDEMRELLAMARPVRVNEALVRMLGFADVADFNAHPPAQSAAFKDEVLLRQFEMAFRNLRHIDGRTVLTGKGGRQIPAYFTVNRLPDGLHLSSYLDLSEQERIEGLRRAAQEELARANRVATVGAFSASIAHELNQPIASLVMDVQTGMRWLRRDPPDFGAVEKVLERMTRTAERAAGIVHRTRETIVAGRRTVQALELRQLLEQTRELLQPDLRRYDVTLEVTYPERELLVRGDPIELQQVLINLISNAAEVMRDQDGERTVLLSVVEQETEIVVSVEDTGPGIPEEHLPKLFQPFFTTKPLGIGMGLQICRAAIEAVGGTLSASNRPNGGACFTFGLVRAERPGGP